MTIRIALQYLSYYIIRMRVRVSAGSGIVLRRGGTARNPAIINRRRL